MNKTISTRVGLITGLSVLLFTFVLQKMGIPSNSPVVLLQFLIVFLGIFISCYLLYKHYAGIRYIESFTHCAKTVAMIIVIVVIGNGLLYYLLAKETAQFSELTLIVMKTIFSFAISGLLSSFFTSYIFHTFTKK